MITDRTVERLVFPRLECMPGLESYGGFRAVLEAPRFVMEPGEASKQPGALAELWEMLALEGVRRDSVIVNIGGGVVSDLGGFAAATYMRGVKYINIPTTLLGMVDAAIGGKTGIDVGPLKNQAGAFHIPEAVIQFPELLETLPESELVSGLGEMLKYGLIASPQLYRAMLDPGKFIEAPATLGGYIKECAAIKERIVEADPYDNGQRQWLNFGHTAGHAFESLGIEKGKPVAHGVAVAHGLLVELILSHTLLGYPSAELYPLAMTLREHFPPLGSECKDNGRLVELMHHDKKNCTGKGVTFTLLQTVANPVTGQQADSDEISTALDIYRDLTGGK